MKKPLEISIRILRQLVSSIGLFFTGRFFGRRSGFTLLEVMMTLGIAAPIMMAIFELVFSAFASRDKAARLDMAVVLAQKMMIDIEGSRPIKTGPSKGDFEEHPGYRFESLVKEVEVDLMNGGKEVGEDGPELEDGEPRKNPIEAFGIGGEKGEKMMEQAKQKSGGQFQDSLTAGTVPMMRVSVTIFYKDGENESSYELKTYRMPNF